MISNRNFSIIVLRKCLVFLLLLGLACPGLSGQEAPANPGGKICELTDPATNYRLVSYVEIMPDSSGKLAFEDVRDGNSPSTFEAYQSLPLQLETHRWYWGRVRVVNHLPAAERNVEWVLYFAADWTALEVFTDDGQGKWTAEQAGSFLPQQEKRFAPTAWGNLIRLNLPPGEVRTVYFRGKSERTSDAPSRHVYLQTTDRFYARMNGVRVGNALFIGFLGMMLLYNLIFYFFVRDRSFIYYSGYLLMGIIYAMHSNDDLADVFGRVLFKEHPQYYAYFKLSIFAGLSCYLAFIRGFIGLDALLPGWGRYFRLLTYLGFPLAVFHFVVSINSNFSYVLEDRISVPYIGLVIGSCVALLYPLYRTGDRKGYFIIAGITALSVGALVSLLSRVVFPPFSIFYLKSGVVIEVLVFSLGLAYLQKRQVQAKERTEFALRESRLIQERQELEANRLREDNRKNTLLAERGRENELLLREIHHRVKNNLEVISSLLELQSVTLEDEGARDAMLAGRSRVSTMGILHQKLYQGDNLGTVGMREYFTDLTLNLGHTFGVNGRVTFHIDVPEDLRLDVDTAVPLGLIANELITNSVKYAFKGGAAGAVEVEMSRVGERCLLTVSDNGSGKTDALTRGTGFGTRLVGMLVQQLEGKLLEMNDGGLRTEVTFPCTCALAPRRETDLGGRAQNV